MNEIVGLIVRMMVDLNIIEVNFVIILDSLGILWCISVIVCIVVINIFFLISVFLSNFFILIFF